MTKTSASKQQTIGKRMFMCESARKTLHYEVKHLKIKQKSQNTRKYVICR